MHRKYLFALLPLFSLLLYFALSAKIAFGISYVQGVQAGSDPGSVTFPHANTQGNFIVVYLNNNSGAGSISAPTDTAGNTYVDSGLGDVLYNTSGNSTRLYYAANVKAKAGNVVSDSAFTVGAFEFSGIATSSPLEVTTSTANQTTGGTGADVEKAGTSTTSNLDLLIGTFSVITGPTTVGSGFTSPLGAVNGFFEYNIQSSTGARAVTASDGASSGDLYAGVNVAAKGSGPYFVQATTTLTSPATSVKSPTTVTAGDLIVLGFYYDTTGEKVTNIVDSFGDAYVHATTTDDGAGGNSYNELWYTTAKSSGAWNATSTYSATLGTHLISFAEYGGLASPVMDVYHGTIPASAGTNLNSGTSTITTAPELIVGLLGVGSGGAVTITPANNFTLRTQSNGAGSLDVQGLEDATVMVPSVGWSATATTSASFGWVDTMVAFKSGVSGGITLVQATTSEAQFSGTQGTTSTIAAGSAVTSGDLLVLGTFNATGSIVTSVVDNFNDTFSIATATNDFTCGCRTEVWYTTANSTGAWHSTTTYSALATKREEVFAEYSGFTSPVMDVYSGNFGSATQFMTSGTSTITSAPELILGVSVAGTTSTSDVAGPGFTMRAQSTSTGSYDIIALEDTTASTSNVAWSAPATGYAGASGWRWFDTMVTFKSATSSQKRSRFVGWGIAR